MSGGEPFSGITLSVHLSFLIILCYQFSTTVASTLIFVTIEKLPQGYLHLCRVKCSSPFRSPLVDTTILTDDVIFYRFFITHFCYHGGGGSYQKEVTPKELTKTNRNDRVYYGTTTRLQICRECRLGSEDERLTVLARWNISNQPTQEDKDESYVINKTNAMREYMLSATTLKNLPHFSFTSRVQYLKHIAYVKYGPTWMDIQKERVEAQNQAKIDKTNRDKSFRKEELISEPSLSWKILAWG